MPKAQLISKDFLVTSILPKNEQKNGLNYYDTSDRIVFVRVFGRIEDIKMTFRN